MPAALRQPLPAGPRAIHGSTTQRWACLTAFSRISAATAPRRSKSLFHNMQHHGNRDCGRPSFPGIQKRQPKGCPCNVALQSRMNSALSPMALMPENKDGTKKPTLLFAPRFCDKNTTILYKYDQQIVYPHRFDTHLSETGGKGCLSVARICSILQKKRVGKGMGGA